MSSINVNIYGLHNACASSPNWKLLVYSIAPPSSEDDPLVVSDAESLIETAGNFGVMG
jgi:hypothetical protein